MNRMSTDPLDAHLDGRAERLFHDDLRRVHRRTDRMFVVLMAIQWIAGIVLALILSPRSWVGAESQVHLHVWLALFGGALSIGPPAAMAFAAPGAAWTRHAIAVGQMLQSSILIHVTGGRIETHFHVFGSLAFLAFYRDWRVLVTGSIVIAADHLLRGIFWPQTVYGNAFVGNLRWFEHTGWVAFTDAFLIQACLMNLREMRAASARQARLEAHQEVVEREVEHRTRELRESEERFREMAERIDQVFWVTTPDLGKILYISPSYERIWGRTTAELLEHPESWAESIHPDDRERVWQLASNHNETGEYKATFRIIRPDGTIRWLFDHGTSIRNEKGEVVRLVGTVLDITGLKAVEEELLRSNAELQRFAYVASHDLQEPLRSVSSFLQLLQRKYQGRLDADADEFIRFAVDGAHRMKRLIGDLLAYSRIETQAKTMEPVDLDGPLDVALENLAGAIQESGARITRDALPTVAADGAQIAQVFQNLIGNAIKFRGERAPEIHVRAEKSDSGWTLHVRDNGIGIESQYAERIFVIFQRLNGQKFPGSGIGLSICKKIVERHKGRIWMESTAGEGTTFSFTLPDPVRVKSITIQPPPAPRRVLVVDDDLLVCKIIRKNLEPMGMTVEEAHTGPEGLENAGRMKPDLLFLDVELPGLNGNQVRRALKAEGATRSIPVIMITGHADQLDPEFALAADWLPKPLSMADVRSRVQAIVPSEVEPATASSDH